MGTMMLLIEWLKDEKVLSHVFMLDAEGLGISDFYTMYDESGDARESFYRQKYGGLGGENITLENEEALFLVCKYMEKNIKYEKPFPKSFDIDIQEFYKNEFEALKIDSENEKINEVRKKSIEKHVFGKICKNAVSKIEFVNYMMMRLIARDREALYYYSGSKNVAETCLTNINGALLYNEVEQKSDDRFVCECVYEDDDGYYVSKVAVTIEETLVERFGLNIDEDPEYRYSLRSFMLMGTRRMYDFEVFNLIAKREVIDIYDIIDRETHNDIENLIYNTYPAIQGIEFDYGTLYIQYFMDNDHVNKDIYVINNDIMFLIYVNEKNVFFATYNDCTREIMEEAMKNGFDSLIEKKDTRVFEQNVLFDFVESGNDDFNDFAD